MLDAAVQEFIDLNIENSTGVSLEKQVRAQQMKLEKSDGWASGCAHALGAFAVSTTIFDPSCP
jgi:hypothetical protein